MLRASMTAPSASAAALSAGEPDGSRCGCRPAPTARAGSGPDRPRPLRRSRTGPAGAGGRSRTPAESSRRVAHWLAVSGPSATSRSSSCIRRGWARAWSCSGLCSCRTGRPPSSTISGRTAGRLGHGSKGTFRKISFQDPHRTPTDRQTPPVSDRPRASGVVIAGTSSDAGKSLVVTGLCRALRRRGLDVAPFKAQNMSNNSMVCADGAEIGRAQYLQAQAAGVEPTSAMNPVLLKPGSDRRSFVVLRGQPYGTLEAGPVRHRPDGTCARRPSRRTRSSPSPRPDRRRGRGLAGGDQPAGRRLREPRSGPSLRPADGGGRRHRPRRRASPPSTARSPCSSTTTGPRSAAT